MINVYQLFPRLFGNKSKNLSLNGSIEENGCGKLADIDERAILALKEFGITHIWLTGVIRHAKLTDYRQFGIPSSHPAVVKGRAGSPYAICDYYDIDPDLAVSVPHRMIEFEALVERIHQAGLGVFIDFVPNHLAREYRSVAKPEGIQDFGENDNVQLAFHPQNNFYYLPERSFFPPFRAESIYQSTSYYSEEPAKATGNDCFSAMPSLNDWFETVKLNYGIDYLNDRQTYFDPVPGTWQRMLEVLTFWAAKGIDGFRVDMAEMVPVPFWEWVVSRLKKEHPHLIMIAEIYQPALNESFIHAGFDFLYDKMCLYNRLHDVLIHNHAAESLSSCWKMLEGYNHRMIRFMENHDEPRLASPRFFGDANGALPAFALCALMHPSALMVYNGQEVGEQAIGSQGFSGDDGRSTIFDYAHMPQHQQWMNDGLFDGALLTFDQKKIREKYSQLLRLRLTQPALREGDFYDLMWANPWYTDFDPRFVYAFLRFTKGQNILIVINFNRFESRAMRVNMHDDALQLMELSNTYIHLMCAEDLLGVHETVQFRTKELAQEGIQIRLQPSQYAIFELKPFNY